MTETAYPTSRAVAERIEAHFAKKIAAASLTGTVPVPEARAVEEIINAAFWASLLREEGTPTTISLALLAPEQSSRSLTFDPPLALDPAVLARVAPAVERPGIHLGVWRQHDELRVWGITRTVPKLSFVLEVFRPGLLVVKYRRSETSTNLPTSLCSRAPKQNSSSSTAQSMPARHPLSRRCSRFIRPQDAGI